MTASPRSTHLDLTAEFDEFYRTARDRLLLQAFALTGDVVAARSGVRDAFVVAWHNWRKTVHAEDPEAVVREAAWRNTLRRASARRWRRDQDFDAEVCGVLDALADLSTTQRRLLVATQLAGMTMHQAARDVALPVEAAERELAAGAAEFATVRALSNSEIPSALSSLAPATRTVRWPRVTIIRRAGAARRRAHTIVGAVAVAAALVIAGVVVTDSNGARPLLDREVQPVPSGIVEQPQVALPDTVLLPVDPVREELGGGGWRIRRTNDNSEGDGRALTCQQQRYADPDGEAAWVRVLRDKPLRDGGRRVIQAAEASRHEAAAKRAYRTYRDWFAGCLAATGDGDNPPQHRLLGTWQIKGVGDSAHLFLLRNDQTGISYATALSRTGRLVTVVSLESTALAARVNREGLASLLGTAVNRMCDLPAAGRCTRTPDLDEVPVFPAGDEPAVLSEWDLPPAGEGNGPWVGPSAVPLDADNGELGVVSCSEVSLAGAFRGAEFRHGAFRSFVLPTADLPVEFGLSQTVAALPRRRAGGLATQVRNRLEGCPDTDAGAGTTVRVLTEWERGQRSLRAWQLETELADEQTVVYNIAFLRRGTSVSMLLFVSVPGAQMSDSNFIGLSERAMQRLGQLPQY